MVDASAITRAKRTLGLRDSVRTERFDTCWDGQYDPPGRHHRIYFNRTLEDPERINHVLWHELGHAMQCERDANGNGRIWQSQTSHYYHPFITAANDSTWDPMAEDYADWYKRYMSIPMEQEAEEIADRYAPHYPLIRRISCGG